MGDRVEQPHHGVADLLDGLMRKLPCAEWSKALHLVGLLCNFLAQLSFLISFRLSMKEHSYDQAAVSLFFIMGFCCIYYGLWIRARRSKEAVDSLTPLVNVLRRIEEPEEGASDAIEEKPGRRRLRLMQRAMKPLAVMSRTQSTAISIAVAGLFLLSSGTHILPHWPRGNGRDLWEVVFMLLHCTLMSVGGTPYLTLNALSWMSSLSMDSALHLLADNVQAARSWNELLPTIQLHQELHDAFSKVQRFFAEDMSVLARVVFGLGLIGLLRVALGTHDVTNLAIVAINFSHIAMACLSGELLESAGQKFHTMLCRSDWEAWPVPDRVSLHIVLTRTTTPTQVKFRYFGAMRLVTLTNIFSTLFRSLQVLRASLESTKWG